MNNEREEALIKERYGNISYTDFMNAVMSAPYRSDSSCNKCGGIGLQPEWCCSGFECGCYGRPVDFIECGCGIREPSEKTILRWLKKSKRQLPKLYAPVYIKFNSLRNDVGENLGVIVDIDTEVVRKVRRIPSGGSWKWQIVKIHVNQHKWDWCLLTDQGILDEHGSDIEFRIIKKADAVTVNHY